MSKICLDPEFVTNTVTNIITYTCPVHAKEPDPWVSGEEAMEMLRVKSTTTLQKMRDEGQIEFSKINPKIILYSRKGINELIQSKINKTF